MPRASNQDFMQAYSFWVSAVGGDGVDYLAETDIPEASGKEHAGFSNVTIPEVSMDGVEYREGHRVYTIKQPGIAQVGTVSMQRGATLRTTAFYKWGLRVLEGQEFRADLVIYEFPRAAQGEEGIDLSQSIALAKKTECFESFPTRFKASGDKDATSSEISIAEVECSVERLKVTIPE